jgi:hypothetical protein
VPELFALEKVPVGSLFFEKSKGRDPIGQVFSNSPSF